MSKSMEEEPEIEDVSPDLEEIKKDPLNSVVGDITTQDDPQIKQSASTPNDLWESWLEKFQGMGDARYGNQHETGNSDDYMSQQVKDDNVYIGSPAKENKEDEKEDDDKEDDKVDDKENGHKQNT